VNLSPIHQPLDCGESVTRQLCSNARRKLSSTNHPSPALASIGQQWVVCSPAVRCATVSRNMSCNVCGVLSRACLHQLVEHINTSLPHNRIVDLMLRLQFIDRLSLCNQPFVVGPLPWTLRRYAAMRAMEATQSHTMVPPQAPPPPPVAPFRFAMIYSDSMVLQRSSEWRVGGVLHSGVTCPCCAAPQGHTSIPSLQWP
jgi:hypothetical protein